MLKPLRRIFPFSEAITGASVHSGLIKAAILGSMAVIAVPQNFACTASKALEEKVQAHPDADTYAEIGNWFGDHKQFDCALEAYQKGLRFEPESAKLYYLIGLTELVSGHPDKALPPLGKSITLKPDVLRPHLLAASALDAMQRHQEAIAEWQAGLRIDPKSIEAMDGLSKSLIEEKDYSTAIEVLQGAPQNDTLTLDLALAYGKAKMLDKSAQVLSDGLKKNPASLPLTSALITIYVNQGHFLEAVHLAEKADRLHPNNIEAERLLLRVLVLNEDTDRARPLAKKLLALRPHDFDFLYLSGTLENKTFQYTEARKHLEEAVAINPNHYNVRYNLGLALLELKDYAGAKVQLEKALELGATEPEVHFHLGTALRNLGQNDLAKEQLKIYQQTMQLRNARSHAASKTAQGDQDMVAGDIQKAVADYREAADSDPQDAQISYKLALALDRAGDTKAESAALEQAIKDDPTFALAHNQLGFLASRDGDSTTAEEHFRLAVQSAPGYTQAWISLAATLGMESRFSEAQQALASALKLEPNNAEALQLQKDLDAAQQPH